MIVFLHLLAILVVNEDRMRKYGCAVPYMAEFLGLIEDLSDPSQNDDIDEVFETFLGKRALEKFRCVSLEPKPSTASSTLNP